MCACVYVILRAMYVCTCLQKHITKLLDTTVASRYAGADVHFMLDNSSNHHKCAHDGLCAYKMNKSSGGVRQGYPLNFRDGNWDGKPQSMMMINPKAGVGQPAMIAKGTDKILTERGVNTGKGHGCHTLAEQQARLQSYPDFVAQKSILKELVEARSPRYEVMLVFCFPAVPGCSCGACVLIR